MTRDNAEPTRSERERHAWLGHGQEQFQAVYENAPVMIGGRTRDGRVFLWNREVERRLGWTLSDANGEDVLALCYPDPGEYERVKHAMDAADGRFREFTPMAKDGGRRVQLWANFPLPDDGVMSIGHDITEQRESEARLRESEAKFRLLAEHSPAAIFIVQDDRHLHVNPTLAALTGYSRDELLAMSCWDLIHPDMRERVRARCEARIREADAPDRYENKLLTRDGKTLWVDAAALRIDYQGRPAVLVTAIDSTASKKAEDKLKFTNLLLEAQSETSIDGILIVDEQRQLLLANRRFREMWGLPDDLVDTRDDEQMLASVLDRVQAPDAFLARVRHLYAHPDERSTDEIELTDGRVFERYSAPLIDRDGRRHGRIWYFHDLTRRRQAELARVDLEAQLLQAQKMEAIGQLAGGIAHDFNNLLTGILGYANLLRLDAAPGSQTHEAARTIEQAAGRASELTQQLLGFARKGKRQTVPVDLHQTIAEVVHLLGRALDKRIRVVQQDGAGPATVQGDPGQMQQVFLNLAVNASDAMPNGGTLTLATHEAELGPNEVPTQPGGRPGRYVVVSVADTGVGMSEEVRERVFEPFFTTKQPGQGTGMGLAMVYGIVTDHGGCVQVDSAPGRGATFRVCLPLGPAPEPVEAVPAASQSPAPGAGRILLVDDEPVVRRVGADMLRALGYHVLTAENGREAVDCYGEHAGEIDLVILDLMMPEMDGRESFVALKRVAPDVRVILSTGHDRDGLARELLASGVRGFVQKPYRLADLSDAVARALGD